MGTQHEPSDSLRVILVGRTGLDARLRMDPGVELVRVRSRLEAIGELAANGDEPFRRSVVVVGPDGVDGPEPAGGFVEALRRVDPCVRIVAAGNEAAANVEECDAVVLPDAAADTLRRAVRGERKPDPETAEIPQGIDPLIELVAAGARVDPAADSGEAAIVNALVHGQDPMPAVLAELRRRLAEREPEFIPTGREAERGGVPDGAEVAFAGRRLGVLRCAELPAADLAPHAAWLARWVALRDQHAQLREAAFTDPLTGAHNRRFFERFLGAAIERARRARRTVTVLVFDVDDFKGFNDRHGHGAGDDILRETVRLLRSVTRPSDKVCRIGGDEFAVIFHEPDGPRTPTSRPPTDVFQIAERFQRAVCEARFPKLGSEAPGTLTISGGLASFPWDGHTPEDLLRRADELALQSKRQGKNAIRFGPDSERVCPDLSPD